MPSKPIRVTLTNGGLVFHPSHPPGGPTMVTLTAYSDTATAFMDLAQAKALLVAASDLIALLEPVFPERAQVANRWGKFLETRLALVAAWTDEGRSVEQIVSDLCVDPGQIRLLQETIYQQRKNGHRR